VKDFTAMTNNPSPAVRAAVAAALKVKRERRVPVASDPDIRDLPTERKDYKNGTTRGQGLVVFVTSKGAKSFRFNYKDAKGANRTHTLGAFGKINYAQAIALFDVALERLANKEDIRAAQIDARKAELTTLADEFGEWFPLYKKTICADYAKKTAALAASPDLAPLLKKRVTTVDMPAIRKFLREAEVSRSVSFSYDVVHLLDKLFEHSRGEGRHKGDNPARGVVKYLKPRDSQHWSALQLSQLSQYFADLAANKSLRFVTRAALELLPYLTLRPSVLRFAEWKWIKWDHADGPMMLVPPFAKGTKQRTTDKRDDGKGKNYVPYHVPLSRQVVAMLRKLHAVTGGTDYLFPGHPAPGSTKVRPVSVGSWLIALRRLGWDGSTEARPAITVHGFRALFATSATERFCITRRDEHALEFQQDHKLTGGVRANYTRDKDGSHRRLLIAERVAILQWWADEIETVLACKGGPLPVSRVDRAAAFVSADNADKSSRSAHYSA
jgi:integrase